MRIIRTFTMYEEMQQLREKLSLNREAKVVAPSRAITPAEQLEMIKRMEESTVRKSFDDISDPSKQDLKVVL